MVKAVSALPRGPWTLQGSSRPGSTGRGKNLFLYFSRGIKTASKGPSRCPCCARRSLRSRVVFEETRSTRLGLSALPPLGPVPSPGHPWSRGRSGPCVPLPGQRDARTSWNARCALRCSARPGAPTRPGPTGAAQVQESEVRSGWLEESSVWAARSARNIRETDDKLTECPA